MNDLSSLLLMDRFCLIKVRLAAFDKDCFALVDALVVRLVFGAVGCCKVDERTSLISSGFFSFFCLLKLAAANCC